MGTSGRASIHRRLYSSARTRVSRQYMLAYADLSGRSHAHSEYKSHRGCVISTRHALEVLEYSREQTEGMCD